jgi:hypothetical protein
MDQSVAAMELDCTCIGMAVVQQQGVWEMTRAAGSEEAGAPGGSISEEP